MFHFKFGVGAFVDILCQNNDTAFKLNRELVIFINEQLTGSVFLFV
jgi:hypothetical protein